MNNIYTYELWDKISNIKGCEPSEIFESFPHLKNDDVFLVKKCGEIIEINSINTCRVNMCMSESTTSEDIAQYYIDNIELSSEDKISILEAEKIKLQEELKYILATGDMRSLAEVLYPEDFENIVR